MSYAMRFYETGGPEVMRWEKVGVGETAQSSAETSIILSARPASGYVRIRHHAIGVNFIDTYYRSGLYPITLPAGLGEEAAGVIEAVGEDVTEFAVGDRVAYADSPQHPIGAYSEVRDMPVDRLVKLPDAIGFQTAAAMMLRGLTVQYLLRRVHRVMPGETILFHAIAGGVGLIACQWAKALGATVIGTVSTREKAAIARAHGCDHVIISKEEHIVDRVKDITGGKGVPVVYDSIGKDTFSMSLDCLSPLGLMVSFGNSSGAPPALELRELARRGSLFITRPTLYTYTAKRSDLLAMAGELFAIVASGQVKIEINQTYALKDAALAHADLTARKTTGSTILIP
ncbi:MAG TPA: quinone oxidoreductase [Rugosibacter sp.]|nr:quinone oxidoreductase [Rugosibacter sp.]HQN45991.1 quinone oxidoreductase [Rugosibacter sp.]